MRRSALILSATAAALLAAVLLWPKPIERSRVEATAFAPSLRGTEIDGLTSVQGGVLQVGTALRELFDYYLSSYGERNLVQIEAAIHQQFSAHLPPAEAARAKDLFRRYLAYKRDLLDLSKQGQQAQGDALALLEAQLQRIRLLRTQHFSLADARALFANEDAYASNALARLRLQNDTRLSQAERQRQLAELDQQLDVDQRAARLQAVQHVTVAQQVAQARAAGAKEEEVWQLRSVQFGPAAANRLAQLDREEAQWQQRITRYQAEFRQLQSRVDLSEAARAQAVQQLRDSQFSAEEQRRLAAYEE